MPEITKDQAVEKLKRAIAEFHTYDLRDIYNEFFPRELATEEEALADETKLAKQIEDHIRRGLEIEEILDLWPVVFPGYRNAYYDEETDKIHFEEESEPLQYAD